MLYCELQSSFCYSPHFMCSAALLPCLSAVLFFFSRSQCVPVLFHSIRFDPIINLSTYTIHTVVVVFFGVRAGCYVCTYAYARRDYNELRLVLLAPDLQPITRHTAYALNAITYKYTHVTHGSNTHTEKPT